MPPPTDEEVFEHEIAVLRPEVGDILVFYYPPDMEKERVSRGLRLAVEVANRVPCLIYACPSNVRLELVPADRARDLYRRLRAVYGRDDA